MDRDLLSGKRVLLGQRSANLDGSAISGLIVAKALRQSGADVVVAFGHYGPMQDEFRALGCEVLLFPHGDWLREGRLVKSFRRLMREWRLGSSLAEKLAHQQFDLVYVNSLVSMSFARFAHLNQVPCVWHIRELFSDVGGEMVVPTFGGRSLVRFVISRLATQVATNSKAVCENILGEKLGHQARVIYNSGKPVVDSERLGVQKLRSSLGIPSEAVVLGVPSTLRPMKGQEFLVQTLPSILKQHPTLMVVMLGEVQSEYGGQVKGLVNSLGLNNVVLFPGTFGTMGAFYTLCDAICIPSIAEPFGRVAVEAFHAECPVVASAVGGLREIVSHDRTGLLFSYGDREELYHCINRILSDEDLRGRLVCSAKLEAEQRFSEGMYSSEVIEVCKQVMSGQ